MDFQKDRRLLHVLVKDAEPDANIYNMFNAMAVNGGAACEETERYRTELVLKK